ncbi:nucleotide-diphospho-sugar transferase [Penicillium angulare]|uniref:nucleotide-diphospho-sugar transferase n=1 Tax=Penicillium angulare TaxID=116970 RepID=UPI002540CEE3|nr:nucleotide-diphospho-sugar transferase [Penicillium angulare]KAJ5261308.1 nucleotide-diphospho-sugar transferase [Penicillium angulare]
MEQFVSSRVVRRTGVFALAVILLVNAYLFSQRWPVHFRSSSVSSSPGASTSTSALAPTHTISGIDGLATGTPELVSSILPSLAKQQSTYLRDLFQRLDSVKPDCSGPHLQKDAGGTGYEPVEPRPRPDYISNADEMREPLTKSHEDFVAGIKEISDLPYHSGTRGIVSSAGGDYMPTFISSLRMIRRTGCTLPVEVFLIDWDEFEPYICEVVLPTLNAKCIVLQEMLEDAHFLKDDDSVKIEGYQIKPFAMILSSFDTFIWMDSDCIPLYDPEVLLDAEPFTSTGLVTWPDFWQNSASPLYFNISGQPEPSMLERASTESGIVLMSKQKHAETLALCVYYNYWGPDYYWALLGQGAYGSGGDKETFVQAASALGADFYAVSEPIADAKYLAKSGDYMFGAMVQADPREDYKLTRQGIWRVLDRGLARAPSVFFVHASNPKFNAGSDILDLLEIEDGEWGRVWAGPDHVTSRFGYDIEKPYWEELMNVTCSLEHAFFAWQHKRGLCEGVQKYWNSTIINPDTPLPPFINETVILNITSPVTSAGKEASPTPHLAR